tara:strand:+ start:85147 stop:85734 length:588 start_codon:yes stop_codon:yes gene_type:complete
MKKAGISLGVAVVLAVAIFAAVQVGNKTEVAFALVEGERPVWDFEGSYEASEELTLRAETERERLEDLLGDGEFPDYDIYVGIAGQYSLLGEGKKAYEYLLISIKENEARSLAFINLGTLLGKVGAPESAKIAYEMGLDRDDNVQNRIQYIQHLEQYFGDDLDLVESAHTFALEKYPKSDVLNQRYESWKKLHDR